MSKLVLLQLLDMKADSQSGPASRGIAEYRLVVRQMFANNF